ncbi:MAG: asparaginase [Anaeroplasma sp.]
MKKILLLTTGGTITSIGSENGLVPTSTSDKLVKALSDDETEIIVKNIMVLDSSNIQPEEWKIIATDIYNSLNLYDGIIVTHGTDTMAYTASMMCFMIQYPSIPIVFTGSQLPISNPLTDAYINLKAAAEMAKSSCKGIYIAFDRKIIIGCRAVKVRTSGFNAFESINLHSIGKITSNGLIIRREMLKSYDCNPILNTNIETNVFLLKLTPTTNPNIIDLLIDSGIKGLVIEAYGAGGISFIRRDFVSKIKKAIDNNVPVVVTSQCLYETSNFNIYEVGKKVISSGAIEALDMTTESAVCKLMYALGQTNDINEVKKIFQIEIASEISHK